MKRKNTKVYKIKICPKCGSDKVRVLLGGEEGERNKGWECLKCGWSGEQINKKEISEDEFLEYTNKIFGDSED